MVLLSTSTQHFLFPTYLLSAAAAAAAFLPQAYLDSLTSAGRWGDAASMLPRLLKDSSAAWERWLFTFAQVLLLLLRVLCQSLAECLPAAHGVHQLSVNLSVCHFMCSSVRLCGIC
jgi:hypothetical protein